MDVIKLNTNFRQLGGAALAGAGVNAATGMVGGGGSLSDKAMKGAIAGALVAFVAPTGSALLNKLWKPEAADKK